MSENQCEKIKEIEYMAKEMRADALVMAYSAGAKAAHWGGGVSSIDILAVLYGGIMCLDAKNPEWEQRDRFILSKGHGVLAYYAALCEVGYISKEELCSFEKNGSDLLGHPVQNLKKGIEFTTGSLGQGLSIGIGTALTLREQKSNAKVFVLMGDGECNEGSVWEAFMAASQYHLDNLVAIIDRNHFQLGGETTEIMDVGNMEDKLKTFGWNVKTVNGHDIGKLYDAFTEVWEGEKPLAVIADTVKGYGFSFSQGDNAWHHAIISKEIYETAMKELGKEPETEIIQKRNNLWKGRNLLPEKRQEVSASKEKSEFVLTKQMARRWSVIGQRAAFGLAILEEAKKNEKLKVLTADVSTSAGLERYRRSLPSQYLDVGIAEQNMMGIATGFSSMGYDVVTTTFAPFQSMRCLEQIRVNLGYMENKVIMIGLASGLILGTLGNTHCCFEDIGVLKSIPNIAIVSPADAGEVGKALAAALNYQNSVYIRLMGGGNCPIVYQQDYDFQIGKAITLKNASKEKDIVTVFASGTMVSEALKVGEFLEQQEIPVEIVNMHTIKPIDAEKITEACKKSKLIVTIEEHNIYGGLGTAVAEVMAKIPNSPQQISIGIPDTYGHGGEYKDLLEVYGLTAEKITEKIVGRLDNE